MPVRYTLLMLILCMYSMNLECVKRAKKNSAAQTSHENRQTLSPLTKLIVQGLAIIDESDANIKPDYDDDDY